jgi:DNA-binding response OmpR family regulator
MMKQEETRSVSREVLIVDDDPFIVEILSASFSVANDITVKSFTSGLEAVTYLADHKPDIVIVDMCLQDMHGTEMIQAVKTRQVDGKPPVIVLSGSDESNHKREAYSAGASVYLLKPFNPTKLRDLVMEMTS